MKLEGEIGEINVIERLVELGRERFTGAVRFENDGVIKIIYFKGGDILSASTNDRSDSVDEILLRAGKVSRDHVKQALAKRKETETLGDALLTLGFITRKELIWGRRAQVIGVIRSIDAWKDGSYTIVADYLPKREEGTIFPLQQLLMELIVTDQDRAKFEQALDGGAAVLEPTGDFQEGFQKLGLNQDAADIVAHMDGTNTAGEIATASGKDAFNVYKLLQALVVLGLASHKRDKSRADVDAAAFAPAEEIDFAEQTVAFGGDNSWRVAAMAAALDPRNPAPPEPAPSENSELNAPSDLAPMSLESQPDDAGSVSSWDIQPPAANPKQEIAADGQWGFDEAQIEAARRAAPLTWEEAPDAAAAAPIAEIPLTEKKRGNTMGWLVSVIVVALLGVGGWMAWNWWQRENHVAEPEASVTPAVPHRGPMMPATEANVPPTTTSNNPATTTSGATMTPTTVTAAVPMGRRTSAPAPSMAMGTPPAAATTSMATKSPVVSSVASPAPSKTPGGTHQTAATVVSPTPAPARPVASPLTPAAKPVAAVASQGMAAPRVERATNGTATITNTAGKPVAQPVASGAAPTNGASDAVRTHYDEMARSFAANPTGAYTIQFEIVCETPSLTRAVGEGGNSIWFVPISFRGRNCYRVFWGHYATEAEARRGIAELPKSLGASSTAVVHVPR